MVEKKKRVQPWCTEVFLANPTRTQKGRCCMVQEFTTVKSSHNRVHKSSPTAQALTTNTVQSDASHPPPHPTPLKVSTFFSVCMCWVWWRKNEGERSHVSLCACIHISSGCPQPFLSAESHWNHQHWVHSYTGFSLVLLLTIKTGSASHKEPCSRFVCSEQQSQHPINNISATAWPTTSTFQRQNHRLPITVKDKHFGPDHFHVSHNEYNTCIYKNSATEPEAGGRWGGEGDRVQNVQHCPSLCQATKRQAKWTSPQHPAEPTTGVQFKRHHWVNLEEKQP